MIVRPTVPSNHVFLIALIGALFIGWWAIPLHHLIAFTAHACQGSLRGGGDCLASENSPATPAVLPDIALPPPRLSAYRPAVYELWARG